MFTEKITFPDGIIVGNQLFTEAVLDEEVFKHTLAASSLPCIDVNSLDDQKYFSAALLAVRLNIGGLFEARMKHDEAFREMVEEFAEDSGRKVKDVTAGQIHPVSVDMIEKLSRLDGRILLAASATLTQRRAEFRTQALASEDGRVVSSENGVPGTGDQAKEPGGDQGNLHSV